MGKDDDVADDVVDLTVAGDAGRVRATVDQVLGARGLTLTWSAAGDAIATRGHRRLSFWWGTMFDWFECTVTLTTVDRGVQVRLSRVSAGPSAGSHKLGLAVRDMRAHADALRQTFGTAGVLLA